MLKPQVILMLIAVAALSAGAAAAEVVNPALAPKATSNKALAAKDVYLPALNNWASVATAAQKLQLPIVIMVSLEGCGYCKTVRQSHLLPLHTSDVVASGDTPRAIVRQIEINGAQTFTDVDGVQISHLKFAQKLGAKVAPTVYFLNAKGEQIVSPLEGALLPDFYGAYLDDALAEATNKIRSGVQK